jgi:flagellar hook-associated protein 1 FlgK
MGLSTTGHNIANVNTEGYSRQRVDQVARQPEGSGLGFIGTGVDVSSIQRYYDAFLTQQVRDRNSSFEQLDSIYQIAADLDNILADSNSSLSSSIQNFFNSIQDVNSDPSSTPARQAMLSEAESLIDRFQLMYDQLEGLRTQMNSKLQASTTDINALAQSIAEINTEIVTAQNGFGQPPNDLLDQRDAMLLELSQYTSLTVTEQGNGSVNVFIGSGQPLVLGSTANTLTTTRNAYDPQQFDLSLSVGNNTIPVTDQLNGGMIGGIMAVRREIIDPTQNAIGRIALALASSFNTQHQLGDDANGDTGGLFFSDVATDSPTAVAHSANDSSSGSISVAIDDVSALTTSDYQLSYDGTNFSLLRLSDNTVVDSGFATTDMPRTIASEGITIDLSGTVAAGDRFLIQPTRYGARDIGVEIDDVNEIAIADDGAAVGDNTNGLALVALQSERILSGGTASLQESYGQTVADVGIKTRQAEIATTAQKSLLDQSIASQSSVSGVNLDEEAANLLRYQQAYQASAQLIAVTDTLFQTLISAVGR